MKRVLAKRTAHKARTARGSHPKSDLYAFTVSLMPAGTPLSPVAS